MKYEIQYNQNEQLIYTLRVNEIQVVPVSATITIYDNTGSVIKADSCTIDTDGTISYIILERELEPALNYSAEFDIYYNGRHYKRVILFDVVRTKLVNNIVTDDIIKAAPYLKDMNYKYVSICKQDMTELNEIYDSMLNVDDNYYTNGTIDIIDGTNKGLSRRIISQIGFTIRVDKDFPEPCDTTTRFVITKSFKDNIEVAFMKVKLDIYNLKGRPNFLIDSNTIDELIVLRTLMDICFSYATDETGIWWTRYLEYKDMYWKLFGDMKLIFDTDDSGNISDTEVGSQDMIVNLRGIR